MQPSFNDSGRTGPGILEILARTYSLPGRSSASEALKVHSSMKLHMKDGRILLRLFLLDSLAILSSNSLLWLCGGVASQQASQFCDSS
jgi:hypothetical protein